MAQEKMVMGAGAFLDLNGGDIGAASRVVLLLLPKEFPSGTCPRSSTSSSASLTGQRDTTSYPRWDWRHRAASVTGPPFAAFSSCRATSAATSPVDRNAGHGDNVRDAIRDYAKLNVPRFHDEKVVSAPENVGGGLVELRNMFLRLDAAAFVRGPGAPFADKEQFGKNAVLGLGPSGVVFVPDDADTLVEKLLGNIRADEHGAPCSDGSRRSPYGVQVLIDDPAVDTKAAGAGAERESTVGGDNLSAVLGIVAVSSAVTAVATGAVGPAVAFGFFLVMLGGVVTAMAAVRGH